MLTFHESCSTLFILNQSKLKEYAHIRTKLEKILLRNLGKSPFEVRLLLENEADLLIAKSVLRHRPSPKTALIAYFFKNRPQSAKKAAELKGCLQKTDTLKPLDALMASSFDRRAQLVLPACRVVWVRLPKKPSLRRLPEIIRHDCKKPSHFSVLIDERSLQRSDPALFLEDNACGLDKK